MGYNTDTVSIPEEMEILLFSLGAVRIGVDTAQIGGLISPGEASERQVALARMDDRIGCVGGETGCPAPMVLLIKGEEMSRGLLIDRPEDIVTVKTNAIHPMPVFIQACSRTKAIWGAAIVGDEMVLLMDLYKLDATRREDRAGNSEVWHKEDRNGASH
ncbi:MAG: hypothetical protein C4519_12665 [Desulfobacteraceae bacterium]|nr:MAG: hypothetical protein C4519_12665 [Desulfobacteraceae bacterium]